MVEHGAAGVSNQEDMPWLPGGAVPRVGETITLGREVGHLPRDTELLVHEVTHVLKDGSIHPLVRCHAASGPDARRVTLEEHGWL